MARPRNDDLETQIEKQCQKWVRIADKGAAIAQMQLDLFMKQVQEGGLSFEAHAQISSVIKDILASATRTQETGLKILAARKATPSNEESPNEAELLADLTRG